MSEFFLILYLFSKVGYSGGPVLEIRSMPSMAACEAVGQSATLLAMDKQGGYYADKARYVCVKVPA